VAQRGEEEHGLVVGMRDHEHDHVVRNRRPRADARVPSDAQLLQRQHRSCGAAPRRTLTDARPTHGERDALRRSKPGGSGSGARAGSF